MMLKLLIYYTVVFTWIYSLSFECYQFKNNEEDIELDGDWLSKENTERTYDKKELMDDDEISDEEYRNNVEGDTVQDKTSIVDEDTSKQRSKRGTSDCKNCFLQLSIHIFRYGRHFS